MNACCLLALRCTSPDQLKPHRHCTKHLDNTTGVANAWPTLRYLWEGEGRPDQATHCLLIQRIHLDRAIGIKRWVAFRSSKNHGRSRPPKPPISPHGNHHLMSAINKRFTSLPIFCAADFLPASAGRPFHRFEVCGWVLAIMHAHSNADQGFTDKEFSSPPQGPYGHCAVSAGGFVETLRCR